MRHQLTTRALPALAVSLALSGVWAGVAQASDQLGYVTSETGTVQQVDLTTGALGAAITVGSDPVALAITPDGAMAYVADYGSSEVVPVVLATGTAWPPIRLSAHPAAIAISPDGKTAYVVSDSGFEWPITLSTGQLGNPTSIPANSDALALAPDGTTAWITNVADGTLTPFTLSSGAIGAPIYLAASKPDGVAITSGSIAYVASNSGNSITPVTLSSGVSGSPIPAGPAPTSVAITADASTAYVTNFSTGTGTVTPVTLATAQDGTAIPVGPEPTAIALVPASGITTAPPGTYGNTGGGSGTGTGGSPNSGSSAPPVTLGNQQLTLTLSNPSGPSGNPAGTSGTAPKTCHARNTTLRVRLTRHTLKHGAKLGFRYVTFTLVKQIRRARRLPATARFPLRTLRSRSYTIKVFVYYSEKVLRARPHHRRRRITVTVRRTLKRRFKVC